MLVLALTSLRGGPGGIPAFNGLLCRAAVEGGGPVRVIALSDPAGGQGPEGAAYLPCGGDRGRFSVAVLRACAAPSTRLCLGHVNLAPLGALSLVRGRGFGVIAHGTEVWQPLPLLRRQALRLSRAVACVSDHTASCVQRQQGVRASRCVRVINALPLDAADLPPLPPAGDGTEVLTVTRLHPGEPKGVDVVLRALPQVPGVRYTVVGEGDDLPRLRALAEGLGLSGRVRFLGRVSEADKAKLLAGCDVFALPSAGEGFGIVYLEAMAHGKPCLASPIGGAPEVVLHDRTGLCVAQEPSAVAAALRTLCGDGDLRHRLGLAGRQRLLSGYLYPHFRARAQSFLSAL